MDAGYGKLAVLRRVSLHVSKGEIVTIVGANGAGKTTLLRTVVGLVRARGGEVLFDGQAVGRLPTEKIVALGCSLVPEGRQVFAPMEVRENLLLGAHVQHARGRRQEIARDLEHVYALFPILETRARQLAGTLSGGEQQMLAIGRALMTRPRLLMLDEPSQGIMPKLVDEIFAAVKRIRETGMTVLIVEQRMAECLDIADRAYILQTGRVLMQGQAADVKTNPDVRKAYLGL